MTRRLSRVFVIVALVGSASAPLAALDARVIEVRAASDIVRAALELRGVFKQDHRQLVDSGGTLYVRVEAELWEDRPAWDRLVGPMRVAVFRVRRDRAARRLSVVDSGGTTTSYTDFPDPMSVSVDVAPADRLQDNARYYLHALTTVGAVLERGSTEVGDVVFGKDEDASGLAAVGKFLFKTAQQISEYLHNVTADVTSRKMTGKQIRAVK